MFAQLHKYFEIEGCRLVQMKFVCDADDIDDYRDWMELVEVNLCIDQSSNSEVVRCRNWAGLVSDLHKLDICEF